MASTIDELLEEIQVHDPSLWENNDGPKGFYAVSDDTGIIAYFSKEKDAFAFRLNLINRKLNS